MNYEIALDNYSNVIKLVNDGSHLKKALYSDGTIYYYNLNGKKIVSGRQGGIKTYIHRSDNTTTIPDIKLEFPDFPSIDYLIGHYSQFESGSNIKAREWYFALNTESDFIAVYQYFNQTPPSGSFYDIFISDPYKYRFRGTEPGYNFCLSIEVLEDSSVVLEWYMSVDSTTAQQIKDSWNV